MKEQADDAAIATNFDITGNRMGISEAIANMQMAKGTPLSRDQQRAVNMVARMLASPSEHEQRKKTWYEKTCASLIKARAAKAAKYAARKAVAAAENAGIPAHESIGSGSQIDAAATTTHLTRTLDEFEARALDGLVHLMRTLRGFVNFTDDFINWPDAKLTKKHLSHHAVLQTELTRLPLCVEQYTTDLRLKANKLIQLAADTAGMRVMQQNLINNISATPAPTSPAVPGSKKMSLSAREKMSVAKKRHWEKIRNKERRSIVALIRVHPADSTHKICERWQAKHKKSRSLFYKRLAEVKE
jgi:hypothetical protein